MKPDKNKLVTYAQISKIICILGRFKVIDHVERVSHLPPKSIKYQAHFISANVLI